MLKRLFVVAVTLLVVFSGLGSNATAPEDVTLAQDDMTIRIGAIFDLTGPTSDVGQKYADGLRGYVDWVNENGGVAGYQLDLMSDDYAYNVENAENLYVQYVNDGAVVFQGWGTGDTEALRGRIAEDQIPFMSASYSAILGNPEDAPYNFLVGTSYSDQAIIMLEYMMEEWVEVYEEDLADMRVVFFHHDSPFGTSPLDDAQAFADEVGVEVMRIAMPGGATGYDAEIARALDFEMTHIIVQNVSTPAALLLRNLDDQGLLEFIDFGCLNWCADELLIAGAGEAAEGALGALPFGPTTVELPGQADAIAWLEASGGPSLQEATLHYTQGWWTMAVMAEGIRLTLENGEELTGENIKANLETITEFDTGGITAPITFTSEDHRGNRAAVVYTVDGGEWVAASDLIDLRAMDDMEMEEEMDEEAEAGDS